VKELFENYKNLLRKYGKLGCKAYPYRELAYEHRDFKLTKNYLIYKNLS
jgi:hypothetical protein